jgi:uncharacterized protein (TIGR00369 family)
MPSTDPNRGEDVAAKGELVGFDRLYGLQIVDASAEEVRARVVVTDDHKQATGIVHGGVYASMAELMASVGTWFGVGAAEGRVVAGMNNNTSFMRPVTEGVIEALARPRHRGRTTWVWDVDITDSSDRLVAASRVTIAVRDL